jgi:hypothetical protein
MRARGRASRMKATTESPTICKGQRCVGYFDPGVTGHDAFDADEPLHEEVRNAARTLATKKKGTERRGSEKQMRNWQIRGRSPTRLSLRHDGKPTNYQGLRD